MVGKGKRKGEKSVRLGLLSPLTGLVKMYGAEISRAGRIACQEVNEGGGVLGRPLELIIEDDGSLPESAVTAASTLVRRHHCVALIGNLLSNSRIAVAYRVAEPLKIPYLNFSFYEGSILSRYFFHFAALPNQQIDQMIPYMLHKYGPRMFFAGNNYEWPRGSIDAAKQALLRADGEIVGEEYCSIGASDEDIERLLDHVAQAAPDVFVPYFAGADQVHLLTRFTERGLKENIAVVMGHYDEMMASKLPPAVRNGFYSSNTYFMTVDSPENKDYLKRLEALPEVTGVWPQGNGVLTNFGEGVYLCVKAFAQAANAAGSLDPEALVEVLETISLKGPQGEVRMDPVTHHAAVNTYLARCRTDGAFPVIRNFGLIEPVIPERYSHQRISHQATLEEDIRLQARMMEQMSEGVLLFNPNDQSILYANGGGERLFGCSKGRMLGKHLAQLIAPADLAPEERARRIAGVLATHGAWQGELYNIGTAGVPFWCSVTITTFTHPVHGEVWMAVLRDITEVKTMQQELEQHRNQLQDLVAERTALLTQEIEARKRIGQRLKKEKEFTNAVLENIEDGIVACDGEGVLSVFNRATREFHCLPAEPIPAEAWSDHYDLFHADGVSPMQKEAIPLFRALQGEYLKDVEMVIAPKQGEKRIVLASAQPLRDEHGALLGAVASMHDVTQRKHAEVALRKAHAELEMKVRQRTCELQQSYEELSKETAERKEVESRLRQAHKMEAIGTLAGGIAHDFNNILAAILGYAEMAKDDIPEYSPAKYQIEQVLQAGYRARDLVKHILSFSRKEAQGRQPVELRLVVDEALKLLRASIPTTVTIQQHLDPASGTILADATQIHQVLMNICTNAAQAMDENGGVLTVSLDGVELDEGGMVEGLGVGSYVRLMVKDTGAGVDPQVLDRIFDPYFTTKPVGKGSGMGLAVVHGIVKSHDGVIQVESAPGNGTTFFVYFPRIAEVAQGVLADNEPLPVGSERILVVDDEASIVELTKRRLERLGYQVTTKTSSLEALEFFRSRPDGLDVVISDQAMPGLTGGDLAKEILAIRPNIPIIICSGYSSKMDAVRADSMGINAFIMKPVEYKELAETLRRVLDETAARG